MTALLTFFTWEHCMALLTGAAIIAVCLPDIIACERRE